MKKKINFENKKVLLNKKIDDSFICGIKLSGQQVKEIRNGKINISSVCVYFENMIPYISGNIFNRNNLLLKKNEIVRCISVENNKPLFPISLFENERGLFKLKIARLSLLTKKDKRRKILDKILKKEIYDL